MPEETFDAATAKKYEGLLERKWTSVVRLQKKIMDLETQTKQLQHELDNATPTSLAARRNHAPSRACKTHSPEPSPANHLRRIPPTILLISIWQRRLHNQDLGLRARRTGADPQITHQSSP